MSQSLDALTRRITTPLDSHEPQKAGGVGGPGGAVPSAPKAPAAPPQPNVLNAQHHPLDKANDSPSAAMLRNRQGQAPAGQPSATPGRAPTTESWAKPLDAARPGALAPTATGPAADDAKLAAVPREQIKKEVEDARAAIKGAKTPEQQPAAGKRLDAANARADAWARATIKQNAMKYAGAGFGKGKDAARYEEALAGPGDKENTRRAMRGQSTCALFARGVWRHAGVADSRLENNYVSQNAVSDVKGIALSRGAWVDVSRGAKGKLPQKGDVLLIDDSPHKIVDPKTGKLRGREHVMVVIGEPRQDPTDPNKVLVDTVEGGQGKGGIDSQAYGAPENGGKNDPKTIRIDRKDGTLWAGERKVMGWADGAKVASPTAPHTEPPPRKAAAKAS